MGYLMVVFAVLVFMFYTILVCNYRCEYSRQITCKIFQCLLYVREAIKRFIITVTENKLVTFIITVFIVLMLFFYYKSNGFEGPQKATLLVGLITFSGAGLAFLGIVYQSNYRINVEVLSKNRQDWINDLRDRVAEFLAVSNHIVFSAFYLNKDIEAHKEDAQSIISEQWRNIEKNKKEMLQNYYYISLLLGSTQQASGKDKDDAVELLEILRKIKEKAYVTSVSDTLPHEIFGDNVEQATLKTEEILKNEWRKVKLGK
ncbi:hypothetical protein B9T19_03620 [Ignatzschineria sp. F8392]|uniref:hypothetical protein n=1 Tax=Ignatzschineria sp. F8392 TaxID=1980117 RepID=UPI000B98EB29|nr:hypothetical protein [Ignatzschineria sp. F8392]OYQ81762.1 hypothetical protein B9T19_03620 [Ignatzschineria sp. F8392]